MTAKKKTSKTGPAINDGKGKQDLATRSQKLTAKYTIWRTKEDVAEIEKVRKYLESEYSHRSYKADSKIYKGLPDLYLNAVKKIHDQDLAIEELTAKLDQVQQLRASFCRILELCQDQQENKSPSKKKQKCSNLDPGDPDCKGCDGYNTDCEDYEKDNEI